MSYDVTIYCYLEKTTRVAGLLEGEIGHVLGHLHMWDFFLNLKIRLCI